ncbi:MAG: xanthine dehydrogenase family protein subunit M [Candidatus Acidiferrales bacterium]
MRSNLPAYELREARDLAGALAMLASGNGGEGAWKPFAGGTDLMVLFEAGRLAHQQFVSIWNLRELRGISESPEAVTIGAASTYADIRRHPAISREFPLLQRAAAETGSIATQNRGTLGGNIANASPAADSPPALLVYDAELELVSASGSRWIPYANFHRGYKKMDLRPDELIRNIRLPRRSGGWKQRYHKVGTRRAQAISKVCFAAAIDLDGRAVRDVRIALGSVAPIPFRAAATENLLRGQTLNNDLIRAAGETLAGEIAPIDDFRSTSRYRRRVAKNLVIDFLGSV